MRRRRVVAAAAGVLALGLAGCGSSGASDKPVKDALMRGVAQIRAPQTASRLQGRLEGTLAELRRARASSAAGRRARRLGIQGLTWTLRGLQARLDMAANDSGKLEAAVRDARRADRGLSRGARLLRAAGRALGLRIGLLEGH